MPTQPDEAFPIIYELGSGAMQCSEHGYVPAALALSHVTDHAARTLIEVRALAEQQDREQARLKAAFEAAQAQQQQQQEA